MADLAYLISIFIFMPNRLSYQLISGTYFATAHVWMLHAHGGFTEMWWEAAMIFPITVICGLYVNWRFHQTRIAEFQQWQSEHQARMKLQMAMDSIETLRGLLPICSYCKKVRDDKGYWHEVESYIRAHSTAEFSHSATQIEPETVRASSISAFCSTSAVPAVASRSSVTRRVIPAPRARRAPAA